LDKTREQEEHFVVGDIVYFTEERRKMMSGNPASPGGMGPFKVVRVDELADRCRCGKSRIEIASDGSEVARTDGGSSSGWLHEHEDGCTGEYRGDAGHHQYVYVVDNNGQPLNSNANSPFSGLWFTKVRPK